MAALQNFLGDFENSLQSTLGLVGLAAARATASTIPVAPIQAASGAPYSAMYVFGDSLSDTGNISLATAGLIPVSPPYQNRSFTNGSVWAQDLAQAIGLPTLKPNLGNGSDFAYGGAETGQTPAHTANPSDLPSQYAQFRAQIPSPQAGALYAVWIGSNDVLDIAGNAALSSAQQQADVAAAVNNEVSVIRQLVTDGAHNLLVLNVPDLGRTPYEIARGAAEAQSATSLASLYDADLTSALLPLVSSSVKLDLIDTFGVLDHAIDNPGAYGFQNVTDPVWSGNLTDSSSGTLAATGAAQNGYLFFDALHPTAQTHQLLASGIAALLNSGTLQLQGPQSEYEIAVSSGGQAVVADTATGLDQTAANVQHIAFTDGTAQFDATGEGEQVARLYQAALNRAPDAGGLSYWTAQLDSKTLNIDGVALNFINSAEFQSMYGGLDSKGFVDQLYANALHRAPDAGGEQYWIDQLNSGTSRAQVLVGFSNSVEGRVDTLGSIGDPNMDEAYRLYQVAFNRVPDHPGLSYWTAQLDAGTTPLQVAQGFVSSAEFAQIFAGVDNTGFVDRLYTAGLHRAPDAAGEAYWVGQLNAGMSRAQVLIGFSDSLENRLNTSQATHDGWVLLPSATS